MEISRTVLRSLSTKSESTLLMREYLTYTYILPESYLVNREASLSDLGYCVTAAFTMNRFASTGILGDKNIVCKHLSVIQIKLPATFGFSQSKNRF